MKRPLFLLTLAGLCLATLPLRAQGTDDPDDGPDTPDVAPATARGQLVFAGKVHEVEPALFTIMPWVARFPRRMEVTTTEETRYFDLHRGSQKDLKPGDAVMFVLGRATGLKKSTPVPPVEDTTPSGQPGSEPAPAQPLDKKAAEKARKAEEKKKADYDKKMEALLKSRLIPVRGVLRLWTAKETVLTSPELRLGSFIMKSALPYFHAKKEHLRIGDRKSVVPGIVLSLTPLTLRVDDRKEQYRLTDDAKLVNTTVTTAKNLQHGQTVMIRSRYGPKDGKVDATIVTVCPEPLLDSSETRRILERELGESRPKK